MKITYIIPLFFVIVLCGCYRKSKFTITAPLKIDLSYNINQVGAFTSTKIINEVDITSKLAKNGYYFDDGKIDKVTLQSISAGANVEDANTAQTIQIEAMVDGDNGKKVLLNKSQVITIESSRRGDILNALGTLVGVDKNNITLRNAIDLINAVGVKDFEGKIQNMIEENINEGIKVDLNGYVPTNQRLVMNLNIQISLLITYSKCEHVITIFPEECYL